MELDATRMPMLRQRERFAAAKSTSKCSGLVRCLGQVNQVPAHLKLTWQSLIRIPTHRQANCRSHSKNRWLYEYQ